MSVEDKQIDKALLVPPKHMPDSHPDTLGHVAVRGDLEAFDMQNTSDYWRKMTKKGYLIDEEVKEMEHISDLYGDMAKERRDYTHDYISRARDAIQWLGKKSEDDKLLPSFELFASMPDFQRAQLEQDEQDGGEISLFDWLTEQKAQGMPDHTPEERRLKERQEYEDDQRLLNFFQSHNDQLARRSRSPEFVQAVDKQKSVWLEGTKKALEQGWLHPSAAKVLSRVNDLKVYEGDYFTTYLHKRGGYFRFSDVDFVSVAKGAEEYATVHEINHALLQTLPEDLSDPMAQVWLFEAITEELTQSFKTGNFGQFDTEVGAYREERELLAAILDVSHYLGAGIDFGNFAWAYSAPEADREDMLEEIKWNMFDAGYPDMNLFSGLNDIMNRMREMIDENPINKDLNEGQKQRMTITTTTARLREWTKVMKLTSTSSK